MVTTTIGTPHQKLLVEVLQPRDAELAATSIRSWLKRRTRGERKLRESSKPTRRSPRTSGYASSASTSVSLASHPGPSSARMRRRTVSFARKLQTESVFLRRRRRRRGRVRGTARLLLRPTLLRTKPLLPTSMTCLRLPRSVTKNMSTTPNTISAFLFRQMTESQRQR